MQVNYEDVDAQEEARSDFMAEGVTQAEADDLITDALASAGDECPGCAQNAAD